MVKRDLEVIIKAEYWYIKKEMAGYSDTSTLNALLLSWAE